MFFGYPGTFDENVSVDPLPMKLLLYSLVPLMGAYILLEPTRVISYITSIPPLIWIVIFFSLASVLVSIDIGASVRGLAAVLILTVAPLLFRLRYGSEDTFNVLVKFAIFSGFANIIYTVAFPQYAVMGGSYAGMVKGLFYHKNGLGQFVAANFILLVSFHRPRRRITYRGLTKFLALAATAILIVAAQSSTAVLMVFVGMLMYAGIKILQRIGSSLVRVLIVTMICVSLAFASGFVFLGLAGAIADSFGKDLTLSGRTDIWAQLIPLIGQRPFLGYGFAVFRQPEVMEQYVRMTFDARSTHNTYLELMLNIGVIGTGAWIIFVLKRLATRLVSVYGTRNLSEVNAKQTIIILLVAIGAFTEAGMMIAPVILWPYMVIALVEGGSRISSRSRIPA
jgi:O-antigen ligase